MIKYVYIYVYIWEASIACVGKTNKNAVLGPSFGPSNEGSFW